MRSLLPIQRTTHLPIGLDVGRSGLRMVQLHETSGGLRVFRAACWQGGGDMAGLDHTSMASRISRFVKQSDFQGRQAITALSTPDIELHPLDLPVTAGQVPQAQFNKALSWEIHRLATLDSQTIQTAHWTLPQSRKEKATHMGVAAAKTAVDEQLQLCARSGLECVKVDSSACALSRIIWRLRNKPVAQVWGILDLAFTHSRLTLCIDEVPVLVRAFDIGGEMWTAAIASTLKISKDAAERNKQDIGLGAKHSDEELAAMIMGILRDDVQRLSLETERSYEYVLQCYAPCTPGDLILVGGGALLPGLPEYLAKQLGIDVLPASRCPAGETEMLCGGLEQSLELCALACGLSLQGFQGDA